MAATADPGTPLPLLVSRARVALENSFEQLRHNTKQYATTLREESPARREQRELAAGAAATRERRGWLWARGFKTVQFITAGSQDHISASIHQLSGPGIPLYAQTTLARAACEAASQVFYLLDPNIGATERMLRSAEYLRSGAAQQLAGAKKLPDKHPLGKDQLVANCQQRIDQVHSWLDEAGIDLVIGRKNGHAGLAVREGGPSVPPTPKLSDLAERAFPEWPNWYSLFSGTAHSLEWSLSTAPQVTTPDGDLTVQPDLFEIACSAQMEIAAMALLDRTFATFLGHEPDRQSATQYSFRHKALDELMRKHHKDLVHQRAQAMGRPGRH